VFVDVDLYPSHHMVLPIIYFWQVRPYIFGVLMHSQEECMFPSWNLLLHLILYEVPLCDFHQIDGDFPLVPLRSLAWGSLTYPSLDDFACWWYSHMLFPFLLPLGCTYWWLWSILSQYGVVWYNAYLGKGWLLNPSKGLDDGVRR